MTLTQHEPDRRDLFVFNGRFATSNRIRRILSLAGFDIRLGWPDTKGHVGVWGQSPTAWRGERIAKRTGAKLIRIEDGLLRSLHPGRRGEGPLGLMIDETGVHFDPKTRSDLEQLLASHPLNDPALLGRARVLMQKMKQAHLTKYSAVDPTLGAPAPGYVLVIDQTKGDASVTACGADQSTFDVMLQAALQDHPNRTIQIKTHPEDRLGLRRGYYTASHASGRARLLTGPLSPWALLENAHAVYTVSSQFGFEAILAGHKPIVFGGPFYAGWGLTENKMSFPRRTRNLNREQLFAATMILSSLWYDPYGDRLCEMEDILNTLEAESRAWREDRHGWDMSGISLWKRPHMTAFFGQHAQVSFTSKQAHTSDRKQMIWASKKPSAAPGKPVIRAEDGFLRSKGLGADLVPPLSLILDETGIYYDPSQESDLETLITAAVHLPDQCLDRADVVIKHLCDAKLSKYNVGNVPTPLSAKGYRVLVPGQVEDDAAILKGTGKIRTNLDLLKAARTHHPDAIIAYKPHPDVEAGLRPGGISQPQIAQLADLGLHDTDAIAAIEQVDEVWTMTSLLGFEALLRGKKVTCLGTPFYAGWGLTEDLGDVPKRRQARPTLAAFAHAVLIDYPRYHDPVTNRPCPVEVTIDRLMQGHTPKRTTANRTLAKLQGVLAPYSTFWRRQ